ncbi:MAG: DUF2190 family protein [Beijerinckiaceae bacterium]|nr:DUF2190 family protein [Beijerinckiaceae bacterium]
MQNYVQAGDSLTVTAPYATESGQGVQVGRIFGVAVADADSADEVVIKRSGVFTMAKTAGAAWAVGDPLYWNDTAREFTRTASGNDYAGVAVAAALSAATTGDVSIFGWATSDPEVASA